MSEASSVSFVWSAATLLQGGIEDCKTPDDEDSCVGGIAALFALLRYYTIPTRMLS